ncbi:MAG: (E)-4-hydroxy-3-methylbut-2-enyl-diphosphate synthase [Treponema sp.]|jgi:(E)-4-hydroxy-3-methylbut-2-enyl-diphosphate synthase|nr:(E)-4-hydroxy-3-methylbut-2-enyl-diphosphate synthase [Treponema sp.]
MSGRVANTVTIGGFAHVGSAGVGGDFPVLIQTMWKDRLSLADTKGEAGAALAGRIEGLGRMGCGLLRFAVPDLEAAETLGHLASLVSMPLVADIHFDYKIALRCMDFPIAKIRVNPGNIGGRERVRPVLEKAAAKGIPIRVGVNAGSLPPDLRRRVDTAEALAEAAERELAVFEEFGFDKILVSMKASGIADTVKANRILAERTSVPLHIGVTEAGPLVAGVARSAVALAALLAEGIGDTLRVSLSDTMENEVIAAREILAAAAEMTALPALQPFDFVAAEHVEAQGQADRFKRPGVTIVSCPRCGRYGFDTHGFTARWMPALYALDRDISVAVMGCAVNGPEEAKHADLGITGAGDKVLIFRHGKVIRTINAAEADSAFREALEKL